MAMSQGQPRLEKALNTSSTAHINQVKESVFEKSSVFFLTGLQMEEFCLTFYLTIKVHMYILFIKFLFVIILFFNILQGLGLLINLVEYSARNRHCLVNMETSCSFDSSFSSGEGDQSLRLAGQVHAVQALVQVRSSDNTIAY